MLDPLAWGVFQFFVNQTGVLGVCIKHFLYVLLTRAVGSLQRGVQSAHAVTYC